jgi:hypothetical protein
MLASTPSRPMVVYSTCLGKCTLEEGYTPQDDVHAAFLIPKGDDDKGNLEFNYIALLKNVWPCFLKAGIELANAPAVVNSCLPDFSCAAFVFFVIPYFVFFGVHE